MEDDKVNSAVFTSLKPVCDRLIMDVSENSVNELDRLLTSLPSKAVHHFQSYVCFPIEVQLHKTTSSQQKQMLVDVLAKLLSLSFIDSTNNLLRISTLLFQQIVNKNNEIAGDVSEELKLSVVDCLIQLWRSATSDTLYEVYTRNNSPRISPIVFMLVQLAKNERIIKLRVLALECLQVLCYCHDPVDAIDVETFHKAQSIVMLMLPGLVSCCVSIATEPNIQNHKIAVANIKLWSGLVCLVMEDGTAEETQEQEPLDPAASTVAERVQHMQRQMRTAEWLRDTAERLTPVTETLLRTQTHTHWQVRQQLALATHSILTKCARNMTGSVGSLVCCLIVLSEDEMPEVRLPASRALTEFSCVVEQDTGQPLLELVESAFYSLLTSAPRIMQGTDDNNKMRCLGLLVGYLRLQGPKLSQVLNSGSFLHRLLMSLLHISRLETSHISLLEECSIREVKNEAVVSEPWKQLMYCNSPQKLSRLQDVCGVLRTSADLHTITHTLIDMFDSHPECSKEIILLLNYILTGGGVDSMKDEAQLVKTVVGIYLQPRLWSVPFSVTGPDNPATNILEAQSNILQVSLLAEGIGLLALAVGGQHFSLCLLRCLYPVLECAGRPFHPLATAGLAAVQNIAQACVGVGAGVTELVRTNVDYLSHHIGLRLRRAHHDSGVLNVLSVVMRHTTIDVLPSLHEIIEDILFQSCDEFQDYNATGFLRVFLTFLVCLRGWRVDENEKPKPPELKKSILEELLEYKRCKETAEDLGNDEYFEGEINEECFKNNSRNEEENIENEEVPKPVEPSIKLTVAILERSLHFLPSKDEQRQILVLDILREGVLVLRLEEDHLLPVVHKIWSPLTNRFQSSMTKPLVMQRAFHLLCTLGNTARDFIRNRTLKQVMPSICQTLLDSAGQSLLKDSGSAYRHTQLYKLQRALLTGLGELVLDLALQEHDLHNILVAASPYLSTSQPPPLQDLCQQLFKQLASLHPNLVWLQLMTVWSPLKELVPPIQDFPRIQLDTWGDNTSEFKKNVSELLQFLGS